MELLPFQICMTDRAQPGGVSDPVFRYFVPAGAGHVNPFGRRDGPFMP